MIGYILSTYSAFANVTITNHCYYKYVSNSTIIISRMNAAVQSHTKIIYVI